MCRANSDILISVEDRHVQNMLVGKKKVELRRRPILVKQGRRVWIYSKIPAGRLTAYGVVKKVYKGPPIEIWKRYGSLSGIGELEFNQYFNDRENGCAIVFDMIEELEIKMSLDAIRKAIGKFHPPQFFKYVDEDSPELELFTSCFS